MQNAKCRVQNEERNKCRMQNEISAKCKTQSAKRRVLRTAIKKILFINHPAKRVGQDVNKLSCFTKLDFDKV